MGRKGTEKSLPSKYAQLIENVEKMKVKYLAFTAENSPADNITRKTAGKREASHSEVCIICIQLISIESKFNNGARSTVTLSFMLAHSSDRLLQCTL